MDPDRLIERVLGWSKRDDRITAFGLCGSYARGDQGPDSDIDICLLTPQPTTLLEDLSWVTELGRDARIVGPIEDYQLVQSVRVFYGPTEVEFGVTDEAWAKPPIDSGTAGVIKDGLKILYDPAGRLQAACIDAARHKID